jgi:hypothetical protein
MENFVQSAEKHGQGLYKFQFPFFLVFLISDRISRRYIHCAETRLPFEKLPNR